MYIDSLLLMSTGELSTVTIFLYPFFSKWAPTSLFPHPTCRIRICCRCFGKEHFMSFIRRSLRWFSFSMLPYSAGYSYKGNGNVLRLVTLMCPPGAGADVYWRISGLMIASTELGVPIHSHGSFSKAYLGERTNNDDGKITGCVPSHQNLNPCPNTRDTKCKGGRVRW